MKDLFKDLQIPEFRSGQGPTKSRELVLEEQVRMSEQEVDEQRQRLESLTVGPVPNRDAQIAGFKAKFLEMLESRLDESGQIVLHFDSDTRVYLDPTQDWEFSSMSTQVQRNDAGQLTGVDLDTFLNTPLRGLREKQPALQKRPHPPRRLRGLRGTELRSPPALDGPGLRL